MLIAQTTYLGTQITGGYVMTAFFITILIIFTGIFYYYYSKPILSPQRFPDEEEELDISLIPKWQSNYTHPLILSSKHYQLSKGTNKGLL